MAIWQRLFRRPRTDDVVEATDYAISMIHPGFSTRDEVVESMVDIYLGDARWSRSQLSRLVDEVWQARLAEQATWTSPGTWVAVFDAFDDLERQDVVARMSFTCCQNCGHAEIEQQWRPGARGYVFFHQQDAERLAFDDAQLFVAFGIFARDAEGIMQDASQLDVVGREARVRAVQAAEFAVGRLAVETFARHGLPVLWSGDAGQRPAIGVHAWRKPLPV